MKQHGLARLLPWEVVSLGPHEAADMASVTLRLRATATTLEAYPWPFTFELRYSLANGVLRIDQRIANEGDSSMPFGVGFHPYFHVPQSDKAETRIPTDASREFDNVTKQTRPFAEFDLSTDEVDAHLIDHGKTSASLVRVQPGASLTVRGSPEFTRWVVWTVEGKDFVCLEPWTCPGNALNTGESLLWLEPGAERKLWLEIA